MMLNTLYPHQPTLVLDVNRRQGRSKKQLKPVVTHDGRVFVARWQGRANIFFGATQQEALRNLREGSAA